MGLTPMLKDQVMWNTSKESCEVLIQHGAKARDQHLRDLRHLSSSCECIMDELGRRQETFVSLFHIGKAKETAVHVPIFITFRHSLAGTFPLLFVSEEIYTPRQLRKSRKWVRNKEPHVQQLLLSFLAAGQLRCWPECSNYSKVKKAVRASFRDLSSALCSATLG